MKVANYGRCIATVDYDQVCKKAYIDKVYRGHVFGQPPYIGTVVTRNSKTGNILSKKVITGHKYTLEKQLRALCRRKPKSGE